jgi:pimeloyl-ACP methyl ester carboxylesterase
MTAAPLTVPAPVARDEERSPPLPIEYRTIHGYRRAFVMMGSGPPLLLIHGIGDSADTWQHVIPALAQQFTVIAPDLLGHGRSDKPRADYSIAAYANAMRDLLGVLGMERVTVLGHSLGGGIAMQFAYQYPERCERLVLVSTGGVSRDVTPLLRLCAVPAADLVLPIVALPGARAVARGLVRALERLGTDLGHDGENLLRVFDTLPDATSRAAFIRTLRSVVDSTGQVVTMLDRSYLAVGMPVLLLWGTRDAVIPYRHARIAHAALPGSRLEVLEGAGHFPHRNHPERFVEIVTRFIRTTEPCAYSVEQWRSLLLAGRPPLALESGLDEPTEEVPARSSDVFLALGRGRSR